MPKYIFFDIDGNLLSDYSRALNNIEDVEVCQEPTNLRDLEELEEIDVFVSPANSYGWMNGGIDAAYSQIFPNVQKHVQEKIAKLGYIDDYSKRSILPVGSATIISMENSNRRFETIQIVCAPTMQMPANISRTPENIFYAMYAILKVTEYLPKDFKVAVPGMGTGVGRVSSEESAKQIREAFLTYRRGLTPKYPGKKKVLLDKGDSYLVGEPP